MSSRDIIFAAAGGSPVVSDPNFEYVTLLLDGNGTNGGQNNTFVDSSTNNFTITRNGNTTQGSFSPYGTLWSNYFDGSSADLYVSNNANFNFGSNNFCFEAFVFLQRQTNTYAQGIINYGQEGSLGSSTIGWQVSNTGYLQVAYAIGSSPTITSSVLMPINQWVHVVLCRTGSTLSIFQNGVQVATGSTSATVGTGGNMYVGRQWYANDPARQLQGYISNARVTNGSSPYNAASSTITIPTAPLTSITNCVLLTCQSNRFIDTSAAANTISIEGTPSVQRFSPFEPSAPYSTSVIGGSGYFDGSGDFLNIANNTAFNLTGNFTVDGWMYSNDVGNYSPLIACIDFGNSTGWSVWQRSNATIEFNYNGYNGQIQSSTITTGVWNHFAVCLSGTTLNLYLNGVRSVSTTISAINSCSQPLVIGGITSSTGWNNNFSFNGYLANLRVVKGSVLYSGTTYTVPTAPTTAVSGTGVLTNFTNASIFDYAMMNDLETVGNAQVSTSVKKFGTGSLYFDGTGDWLSIPNTPNLQLGSGDFTIECWVNFSSLASNRGIMHFGTNPNSNYSYGLQWAGNVLYFWYTTNGSNLTSVSAAWTPSTSVWYFVAVARSGNNLRFFVDGTQIGTTQSMSGVTIFNSTSVILVGGEATGSPTSLPGSMNGYIDDFRITKGLARYTANFTPPTKAFPTF